MVDRVPPLALPSPDAGPLPPDDAVAAAEDGPLAFTPVVPRHAMHNGWTADRQRGFIEALASTGSVESACRSVSMKSGGAYRLRRAPGGEGFAAAWAAALDLGVQRVEDVAMDRALNGVEQPVYSYGKLVGTRTAHNDRLLMFMLRNRAGERFGGDAGPNGNLNAGRINELKAQWLAEHKADLERRANEARRIVGAKLQEMHERLMAGPNPPQPPDDEEMELITYRMADPNYGKPDWRPQWWVKDGEEEG